jgi:hypothetical protein
MTGWLKDHSSDGLSCGEIFGTYFPVRKHQDVQVSNERSARCNPSRKEG